MGFFGLVLSFSISNLLTWDCGICARDTGITYSFWVSLLFSSRFLAGGQAAMSPGSDVSRRAETSGDDASMEGTESETSEASSAKLNAGKAQAMLS